MVERVRRSSRPSFLAGLSGVPRASFSPERASQRPPATAHAEQPTKRPIAPGGDLYGTHRSLEPKGSLPQPALRLDADFGRLFEGEVLLHVDTLNIDAASFAQMEQQAAAAGDPLEQAIRRTVVETVAARGKQHNPVTGSGGMLLGTVLQVAPGHPDPPLHAGQRVASLVSLTLTPLRIDAIHAVRRAACQLGVDGEAVLFGSSACVEVPGDMSERLALAVLDVAGAAPQVARIVRPQQIVVVLGAGGKSGILCVAEARRSGGPTATIVGVEANERGAAELAALGFCDRVVHVDARHAVAVRRAVLEATGGHEADATFSCVNVPDVEMAAVLATRDRGVVYFFAMSTSFTKAALGAEGLGKDVDLFIGNGYAAGHAQHTLDLVRALPSVHKLFEARYGEREA